MLQGLDPTNIVYHPQADKLFQVDAEGLREANEANMLVFEEQVGRVKEWMYRNLLVTS